MFSQRNNPYCELLRNKLNPLLCFSSIITENRKEEFYLIPILHLNKKIPRSTQD